jgi:hypothetical protein
VSKSSTTAKNRFVVLSAEKGTEGIVDASEIPALFVHHFATLSTHDTSGQLKYVRMFKQRLLDAKKQSKRCKQESNCKKVVFGNIYYIHSIYIIYTYTFAYIHTYLYEYIYIPI